jgi:stress response protein SCP2
MEKTFEMKKNDSAFLPQECKSVMIGLGWTCKGSIDLDASIVGLRANKEVDFTVNFGNKSAAGVTHRGDNTSGDGAGDDERIRIDLANVKSSTQELYVTINIYTSNISFHQVKDAYVRLCVAGTRGQFDAGHELADYPLDGNLPCRGIVFCRLARHGQKWSFDALAWGCGGATVKDVACLEVVRAKRDPIPLEPLPPGYKRAPRSGAGRKNAQVANATCDCAIF